MYLAFLFSRLILHCIAWWGVFWNSDLTFLGLFWSYIGFVFVFSRRRAGDVGYVFLIASMVWVRFGIFVCIFISMYSVF
jgi:hypothetical protein